MKFYCGTDTFFEKGVFKKVKSRKVSLICNHGAVNVRGEHLVNLCKRAGLDVRFIFAPEHGMFSTHQDMESVNHSFEPVFGEKVYSLYGKRFKDLVPDQEKIEETDVFIFDLQDVGSRYYTYVNTLFLLLEKVSGTDKHVVVLDRPNPINGVDVEGNILKEEFFSFVGMLPVLNRHGLTAGELVNYYVNYKKLDTSFEVIPVSGWRRDSFLDEYEHVYFFPSPNMPGVKTALLYPGICLMEGTNVSEGRGTTKPFELVGAPFVNPVEFREYLAGFKLRGITFIPFSFRPMFQKWMGQTCHGVFISVKDRKKVKPYLLGLVLLHSFLFLYPEEFRWRTDAYEFVEDRLAIDLLLGDLRIRKELEEGVHPFEIFESLKKDKETYENRVSQFKIY